MEKLNWPAVILTLGIGLLIVIYSHLSQRNHVEAAAKRAACFVDYQKIHFPNPDLCYDIK